MPRALWTLLLAVIPLATFAQDLHVNRADQTVSRYSVVELALPAESVPADPLAVRCAVTFTSPKSQTTVVEAFWKVGNQFAVRFSPTEVGTWTWEAASTDDARLNSAQGRIVCQAGSASQSLAQHGPLRISKDRRHFIHADGSPFFWLADTAWNGVLRSSQADWNTYLTTRKEQGFTAIQFVSTQWRGGREVLDSPVFSIVDGRITVDPEVMARLDARVAAIAAAGLVPAPVLLWALTADDPGQKLSEEQANLLARHLIARWGAYPVVWFLGGDGPYKDPERWQRLGRELFPMHDRTADPMWRPVTVHPSGINWVFDRFAGEPWFDFIGYQSGHGESESNLRWLTTGPPAQGWTKQPTLPIVNLEPNYEGHPSYGKDARRFDAHAVRRAAYWSLLIAPPAGVTYGNNEIWVWNDRTASAENHKNIGDVGPWRDGLKTDGLESMRLLRGYFESGPWQDLRPATELLATQPGEADPANFIAAAQTEDKGWTVFYTPVRQPIRIAANRLPSNAQARWIEPRTGKQTETPVKTSTEFTPPGEGDWVLEFRAN